jgi:hypothetical protein
MIKYSKIGLLIIIFILLLHHSKDLIRDYLKDQFINELLRVNFEDKDIKRKFDVLLYNFDYVKNKEIFLTLKAEDISKEYYNLEVHPCQIFRVYSPLFLLGMFVPLLLTVIKST